MTSRECALIAVLTVIVIIVICRAKNSRNGGAKSGMCGVRETLVNSPGPLDLWVETPRAPYTYIQNSIDAVRGSPDATNILLQGRPAFNAYTRSSAELRPEDLAAAERAAWMQAAEQDRIAPYDIEKMTDPAKDTMQHFETAPALDYQSMITDLVVDPRTRMNHHQWVDEMQGWSGTTTMKVDTFEPQLYLNWQGLQMPQAGVGQYNPLQLTEVDDTMLAVNKPFRFNG
jgi:hypothetical protein